MQHTVLCKPRFVIYSPDCSLGEEKQQNSMSQRPLSEGRRLIPPSTSSTFSFV